MNPGQRQLQWCLTKHFTLIQYWHNTFFTTFLLRSSKNSWISVSLSLSLKYKTLIDWVWRCSEMLLRRWCLMAMACLTIHTPVVWMFSACRHPHSVAGRIGGIAACILIFTRHECHGKKQRQTQTNEIKWSKENKSKIVGTKKKTKTRQMKNYTAA